MFNITNTQELKNTCNNLDKTIEINKFPVEIVFDAGVVWQEDNITEYFTKYFQHISKITNNRFFIKIVVISYNGAPRPDMLVNMMQKLEAINMIDKVTCLLLRGHTIMQLNNYFATTLLDDLNCLHSIEFDDAWCDYPYNDNYAPAIGVLDMLNDFCKKHENIESCVLKNCREYLIKITEQTVWKEAYSILQNTLKKNEATLEKLENCIETINELAQALDIYKSRLHDKKTTNTVRNNDKKQFEEISERIERTKQKFKEYSEILMIKNNLYAYYYLAKYQAECEENINYKQIFEYLEKITPPVASDPEKDKHADLYYKAKSWQATLCLVQAQYTEIKGLDLSNYPKDDNGNYIFPHEIEAERIRLVIKYALEAKQESGPLTEYTLQEYILGNFVASTNNTFANINSKDKDAFDVIWQLVEAFKKHVDENKKETKEQEAQTEEIIIFRKITATQQLTNIPTSTNPELEETNDRKRKRISRSASPTRNYTL